jgi:hypothetical protein
VQAVVLHDVLSSYTTRCHVMILHTPAFGKCAVKHVTCIQPPALPSTHLTDLRAGYQSACAEGYRYGGENYLTRAVATGLAGSETPAWPLPPGCNPWRRARWAIATSHSRMRKSAERWGQQMTRLAATSC